MAKFWTNILNVIETTYDGGIPYEVPCSYHFGYEYSYTQNQQGNYTTLSRKVIIEYQSSDNTHYVPINRQFTLVGGTTKYFTTQIKAKGYAYGTIYSDSVRIDHNADGTHSDITLSIRYAGYGEIPQAYASRTISLPTIQRASIWNNSRLDISNLITGFNLPITKYVSSYYNVAEIRNSNNSVLVKTINDVVNNTPVVLDSSELNTIYTLDNNENTYPLVFYIDLKTYTNSSKTSQVGSTQRMTCYASLPNPQPTFSVTYEDTNASTLAITTNNQQLIQNNSTARFNLTSMEAKYGSTLTNVSIDINGVVQNQSLNNESSFTFNYGVIDVSSNINAKITLKDSRNLTTLVELPLTILGYSPPTALITLQREANFYSLTDIQVDANYSSLDNKNTILIKYRIKKTTDENWGNFTNLSDNVQSTFTADNLYEWNVQIVVQDSIDSTTYNYYLGIGQPILFIDKKNRNVGVDCFPKSTNALEVQGNTEVKGDFIISNPDGTNPQNLLDKITPYVLWEDDNGITPSYTNILLNDNIYNYWFAIFVGDWGIKFVVPIIDGYTQINGGMNYPQTSNTNNFATAGIVGSITNYDGTKQLGEGLQVIYLRQLIHTQNGNHGSFDSPKLYKVIGFLKK